MECNEKCDSSKTNRTSGLKKKTKKCQTPTCGCSYNTYGKKQEKPYCPTKFVVIMANLGKFCNGVRNEEENSAPSTTIKSPFDSSKSPNVILCFKVPKPSKADKAAVEASEQKKKKKRSKSCELRNGILYKGCACESRNGLQDDCQRSECRGSPECLTNPPTCGPSEFANGKDQTKKFEEFIKIKKDIEQQRHDIANGITKPKAGTDKKASAFEYECVPVDLIREGAPCPLCSKRLDKNLVPNKATAQKKFGPDIPEDCICCQQGC